MARICIVEVKEKNEKSSICGGILRALPNWFGVPESVIDYTQKVVDMPFYACYCDDLVAGFVAIKVHNADTSEVCVMGVIQEYHRMGIGKRLIQECVNYCRIHKHCFLTVKTLADLNPDEGYARTRAFYLSCGFRPLEVFTQIWDERNPCLFLAMAIDIPALPYKTKGTAMEYKEISKENLLPDLLLHFNRYQNVKCYYAKTSEGLVLQNCDFTEQWDENKKQTIINEDFSEVILYGGTVLAAFDNARLIGFGCVDGRAIGSEDQYLQLIYLHVSYEYRNMGIGRRLFGMCAQAAKKAGARKLYISAASYYETQCFYREIGCVSSKEDLKHLCDIDPYDIEMEYEL